jgi:lipopolysaccharide/colanic/teichoic acid biosynthesis glycosyltransferase
MRLELSPALSPSLAPALPQPAAPAALHDVRVFASWLLDGSDSDSVGWLLKRTLDVLAAVILLILVSPVLLLAALLVRLSDPGPVVFQQPRAGYRGQPFTIYKLRTMVQDAPELQSRLLASQPDRVFFKLSEDPRITRLGRFLRRTSVDELPQLINVIRGDMSLIGPRPLPLGEAEKLVWPRDRRRFAVPPGITGLWQVSGRSLCSDAERLQLDTHYVEEWSLFLDIRILLRTVPAVLTARGAA